jgi:putative aldouronate transport system substrate-binding protein
MDKKNLKMNSLLLAALMLLSATGCGGNKSADQKTTEKQAGAATTAAVAKEVKKPEKIKAMLDIFSVAEGDGRAEILAKYKELTGITLTIDQPPHNQYYEKVNLAFASGDLPDVVELAPSDNSAFLTYSTQGALADITDLVAKSKPMAKANKDVIDGMKIDGKLYGFPNEIGNGTLTMYRKDWLDKLGMKAPTNYAEYLEMLRAFTFKDPDGNGKNDTKGFTGAGLDAITDNYRFILDFMQDAAPAMIYKNGKWVDGFQEPEMIKAMERLSSAYKEGLIDKDIITNKTSTAREKVINGEVGTISYWAGGWNKTLNDKTKQVNPNASIVSLPALKEVTYMARVPAAHCITSASNNVEGIFKYFLEYMHDGAEGQTLFSCGAEGITYKVVDGKGEWLPTKVDPKTKYSKTALTYELALIPFDKELFTIDPLAKESNNIFLSKMVQSKLPVLTDTYIKMNADITQVRGTILSKVMVGELSAEEGLKQYKAKVNGELQMEKILTEMNAKK